MKVGRLLDHPTTDADGDYGRRALELVFEQSPVPIELVEVDARGSVDGVLAGARALADEGCVLLLGPSVTDFAVPLVPVLGELQVPAINWCGSALARGAWAFQLKVGSLPDEAGYLTQLLAMRRQRAVALVRDRGPIGEEYAAFVRPGLGALGIDVVADVALASPAAAATAPASLRPARPECVVYLGLGPTGVALHHALRAAGWDVPLIGNVGLGVAPSPDLEGVVFTDVVDDDNPVLRRFVARYAERHGTRPIPLGLGAAHDLAATAVAVLAALPAATPASVRHGLESLRGLPAALGAPGTTIGFAPFDRDGYKGPLILYREVRDGRAVRHRP
jgi:branched-chain amino acid transport system substrate-binding protein